MASADVAELLKSYLSTHPIVGPRITHTVGSSVRVAAYTESLPNQPLMDTSVVNAPATALVIGSIPGRGDSDVPMRWPRILTRCYGPTRKMVRSLDLLVQDALWRLTLDVSGVRLVPTFQTGPTVGIDVAQFPYADSIYEVSVI